jgi:xanthine dehydrogenase accessory factor
VRLWLERLDAADAAAPSGRLTLRGTGGGAPIGVSERNDPALDAAPRPVARAARAMLAGERPEGVLLLRGVRRGDGVEDWLIEPAPRVAPPLWIYGAGHVGRALVRALDGLGFDLCWVDTARERFPDPVPDHATMLVATDPADAAGLAPPGAIHFVMTFSHAIDLAICHRLLMRGDFARLGLIGSETKRARFRSRLQAMGVDPATLDRLTCPIGIGGVASKTPQAIAIVAAAQALQWREDDMGKAAEEIGSNGGLGAHASGGRPA